MISGCKAAEFLAYSSRKNAKFPQASLDIWNFKWFCNFQSFFFSPFLSRRCHCGWLPRLLRKGRIVFTVAKQVETGACQHMSARGHYICVQLSTKLRNEQVVRLKPKHTFVSDTEHFMGREGAGVIPRNSWSHDICWPHFHYAGKMSFSSYFSSFILVCWCPLLYFTVTNFGVRPFFFFTKILVKWYIRELW